MRNITELIIVQLRNIKSQLKTASAPRGTPEDLRTRFFRGRKFSAHVWGLCRTEAELE